MKLALIPPLCFKEDMWQTDYQLLLPVLLDTDVDYENQVDHLKNRGDFLILDNGAAENDEWPEPDLIDMAIEYRVSELAIPDVLGDMEATVRRLQGFFNIHEEALATNEFSTGGPDLGFVAQGKNHTESIALVKAVMNGEWSPYLNTVYLPRLLVKESGNLRERIDLAHTIHSVFGDRLNIHMFGSAPEWPREALAVSTECPFVRGMDTSMPYNWAFARQVIGGGASIWDGNKPLIRRPFGYFDCEPEEFDQDIMKQNVRVMHTWSGSTPLPSVKSVH